MPQYPQNSSRPNSNSTMPQFNPQYPHLTQPNPNVRPTANAQQNYMQQQNFRPSMNFNNGMQNNTRPQQGYSNQLPLPSRPNSSPPPTDNRALIAEIAQLKSQISHKSRTPTSEESVILQVQVDSLTEYSTSLEQNVAVLTQENIDVRTDCRAIESELSALKQRSSQLQVDNQKLNQVSILLNLIKQSSTLQKYKPI